MYKVELGHLFYVPNRLWILEEKKKQNRVRIVFPVCSCGTTWLRPICVFFFFFFFLRFWQPRNGDAARIKSYYKHGSFLCECSQSSLMIPLLLSIWFLTHQSPCNTSSKPFHLLKPQPPPLLSQSQWINFSPTLPEGLPGWLRLVKNLLAMRETQVQSLGGEDPLEKGVVPIAVILAWRIPWTEEPGGQSPWDRKELETTE